LLLTWSSSARAQAAPNQERSGAYYAGNVTLTLALAGAGLVAGAFEPSLPGTDPEWFPGDRSLQSRYSSLPAGVSDVLLLVTLATPVLTSFAQGVNFQLANRGIVYSESLALNFALNSLVKVVAARPRPYTYALEGPPVSGRDRYMSFYSGHSSISFGAAVTGSYLFAEAEPALGFRYAFWGGELFLAAMTANLRLRAGKHYYSDVIVGALVGTGLSVGTLLLHGADYLPEPGEYAAAGGGIVLGTLLAQLLPVRGDEPGPYALLQKLEFAPWAPRSGELGLLASGEF